MLRIATIAAAALIGTAAFAWSGDQGEPDQGCDGSMPEMVDCLNAKTAYWDKRMTIAYQLMLKAGRPEQRKQLRVAQRLWIQYRDANCLCYDLGQGSVAKVEFAGCLHSMTEARAKELDREDRN